MALDIVSIKQLNPKEKINMITDIKLIIKLKSWFLGFLKWTKILIKITILIFFGIIDKNEAVFFTLCSSGQK